MMGERYEPPTVVSWNAGRLGVRGTAQLLHQLGLHGRILGREQRDRGARLPGAARAAHAVHIHLRTHAPGRKIRPFLQSTVPHFAPEAYNYGKQQEWA